MGDEMSSAGNISGKVVVVTGGARGIGYATARLLRDRGALVAIGDIDKSQVDKAGSDLGLEVFGRLDVTDRVSFKSFLDEVERRLGPLDVLINNAGVMPAGRFAEEADRVTRRILDINVYGVVLGSKLAAQRMLGRGTGHVINIASLAAETPTPGLATYCASKAAALSLTDALRIEHRDTGLEFSAVLPCFTNTELVAGTQGAKLVPNAEPEDIAEAIAELICDPRPRVAVTRLAGLLVGAGRVLPGQVTEFFQRRLGMTHVMLDGVDVEARRAYESRARGLDG
ncbi:SDR family oxidoreductase [Nocardia sp. NPDC058518]|uniref:SDR family oxidoreductase n=1 Tax=Nocardia sp. NPDC058518 TaxID=3346534 RepID=UPI00365F595F